MGRLPLACKIAVFYVLIGQSNLTLGSNKYRQAILVAYNILMMPKRSRKQSDDVNVLAKIIVDESTEESTKEKPKKNPAAVALGRLGGLKGGKARAKKLSAKRRKEIAKKAAEARWNK